MITTWSLALLGGAMIGAASALLLLTHGRIAGISGIVGSLLPPLPRAGDRSWRVAFVAGLLATGALAAVIAPQALAASPRAAWMVALAGLLVGYGTRWGSGCTSGHGVCGVSRLAPRSLVAVATFMVTGALSTWLAGGAS
jgi:uncharacterized protein